MIRIGNKTYANYYASQISMPYYPYANMPQTLTLYGRNMYKVGPVYVGDKRVYPEPFRYTLKYRMRLDFTFNGVSHGNYRPSSAYCKATTTGYIEDIVRLNTAFPTYIRAQPLVSPGDHYIPRESSGELSNQPWGQIEMRTFSGTEHLITPACALTGAIPGTGSRSGGGIWIYGTGIYAKYAGNSRIYGDGLHNAWQYIMQRTVHSVTTHQERVNWKSDDVVTTDYTIRARMTNYYSDLGNTFTRGAYENTNYINHAFPIRKSDESLCLSLGVTYRDEDDPGEDGLFLMTDMAHYGSSNKVLYAKSPNFYGCLPGDISSHDECFSVKAPMFSGQKHFDCYDTGWNSSAQDITGWDDPRTDEWSHTDLKGSFTILENNNPLFGSIGEYVQAYLS